MEIARIQPPLALVSAVCIAVVPLAGTSAAHAVEAVSAAHTTSVATVPTRSIPYTLDAYQYTQQAVNMVGQALTGGLNDLLAWGSIPGSIVSLFEFPNLNSALTLLGDVVRPVWGVVEIAAGVFGAVTLVPAAVVVDTAIAIGQAIFPPSAAANNPAAVTKHNGAVKPAATTKVTLTVTPRGALTATTKGTGTAAPKAASVVTPTHTSKAVAAVGHTKRS
jgi:hypothetical protein